MGVFFFFFLQTYSKNHSNRLPVVDSPPFHSEAESLEDNLFLSFPE